MSPSSWSWVYPAAARARSRQCSRIGWAGSTKTATGFILNRTSLDDADRWPWLRAIADWIDATRLNGHHGIVACSALKRAYRDILIGNRRNVRVIYLKGDRNLIARRIAARADHFMPPALLDSQFEALEEPKADERPIVVSIAPHPREIVETIVRKLGIDKTASRSAGTRRSRRR
jgi:carbohydrate kinase (thermoresistant glucokinase family)